MQSPHDALRRNILSLSKQLHQALVFGEDTDVIYLFYFIFFFQDKTRHLLSQHYDYNCLARS